MSSLVKVERLSRLAGLLEKDAAGSLGLSFDLHGWSQTSVKRGGLLWLRKNVCHTAACAVGLACLSGEFADDNLQFELQDGGLVPRYAFRTNWDAVEVFFGLTRKQAEHLFLQESYDGATRGPEAERVVAERIRAFVAKVEKPANGPVAKTVKEIKRRALEGAA